MANRWERGKLGPYTLPQDFTTGGVAINGIGNVTPKEDPFLVPAATLVYFDDPSLISEEDDLIIPSGQTLNRVTDSALFNAIGTQFGNGDGSTTFDLPDIHLTSPRCFGTAAASGIGTLQKATMWDHDHNVTRVTSQGDCQSEEVTAPAGITEQSAVSIPTGSPIANANANVVNITQQTVPHPNLGPSEAIFKNSAYYFATQTFRMFPSWTKKPTSLPLGAIIAFIGNDDLTPFTGYQLCDGSAVDPALFPNAASKGITNTPDMRGRHVASDYTSPTNASARVSTLNLAAHRHRYTSTPSVGSLALSPLTPPGTYDAIRPFSTVNRNATRISGYPSGSASLGPGNENRPVNMAVNFFMRVG